jgi:hypothetical protein
MTLKCVNTLVNTDSSYLVILPLAPLLLPLYLVLISQAASPSPSPMPIKINSSTDTASHHGEYYITGADLIVRVRGFPIEIMLLSKSENRQVQDTLFRIHRYFFLRESAHFRSKLPHAPSPGDSHKGSSDNNPLVLDDALKVDFERFLWVFYNP